MARTRIEDLPKDMKISRKEMGRIYGGRRGDAVLDDVVCLEIVQRRGVAVLDDVACLPNELKATVELDGAVGFSHGVSQPGGGSTGPTRKD